LKGFEICKAEVTTSEKFDQWHVVPGTETHRQEIQLPVFVWLKVLGRVGIDDCGLVDSLEVDPLIVSERVLDVLGSFKVNE
jgi:hypothetical protein